MSSFCRLIFLMLVVLAGSASAQDKKFWTTTDPTMPARNVVWSVTAHDAPTSVTTATNDEYVMTFTGAWTDGTSFTLPTVPGGQRGRTYKVLFNENSGTDANFTWEISGLVAIPGVQGSTTPSGGSPRRFRTATGDLSYLSFIPFVGTPKVTIISGGNTIQNGDTMTFIPYGYGFPYPLNVYNQGPNKGELIPNQVIAGYVQGDAIPASSFITPSSYDASLANYNKILIRPQQYSITIFNRDSGGTPLLTDGDTIDILVFPLGWGQDASAQYPTGVLRDP